MSSWQEATRVRAPDLQVHPFQGWSTFQWGGGSLVADASGDMSKHVPFSILVLQSKCEGWGYFFLHGYTFSFSWKIMIWFRWMVERFFLGYDLPVLDSHFFIDEEVEILCRHFSIVFAKEYIDVYNDEDKRHRCEDAASFLAPLLSTICYCIHDEPWWCGPN